MLGNWDCWKPPARHLPNRCFTHPLTALPPKGSSANAYSEPVSSCRHHHYPLPLFAEPLARNFALAVFGMYAMLALAFRNYVQPFIVIASIPFGLVGATIGHLLVDHLSA